MANTKDLESSAISASKIKLSTSSKTFYVICYVVVAVVAIICLIPFLLLISGSFTSEQFIRFHGFSLIPGEFSTEAY
jgi:putative aldouronate transport system permease protein